MTDLPLVIHEGAGNDWPVLLPDGLLCQGSNSTTPVNLVCSACGRVLASSVYDRQFIDVLAKCPNCGLLLRMSHRRAGDPVPGRPVVLPRGYMCIANVLSAVGHIAVLIGQDAMSEYVRETGRKVDVDGRPIPTGGDKVLSQLLLQQVGDDLVAALGDNYAKLALADEKGQCSKTPPATRHRVIELIEFSRLTAERFQESQMWRPSGQDEQMLAEAITLTDLLRRWQYHPQWRALADSLAGAEDPRHTLILLNVASFLVDSNNGVGIHEGPRNARIPDLWIEPSLDESLEMEVKTPQALRVPSSLISPSRADQIVANAYKDAKGQLRLGKSSVLVIGGFRLGPSLDVLTKAAERWARSASMARRRHIAGVLLADLSYRYGVGGVNSGSSFLPCLNISWIPHPGYSGKLTTSAEGAAWSRLPDEMIDVRDVDRRAMPGEEWIADDGALERSSGARVPGSPSLHYESLVSQQQPWWR